VALVVVAIFVLARRISEAIHSLKGSKAS